MKTIIEKRELFYDDNCYTIINKEGKEIKLLVCTKGTSIKEYHTKDNRYKLFHFREHGNDYIEIIDVEEFVHKGISVVTPFGRTKIGKLSTKNILNVVLNDLIKDERNGIK